MTVLHATEPATVFLSCWARGESIGHADVERALDPVPEPSTTLAATPSWCGAG